MRCKTCKEKFEPKRFLQKTCDNVTCALEYSRKETKRKKNKEKRESKAKDKITREKLKTKSAWEKDLEFVFNRFIRNRDKEMPCISCDAPAGTYKLTAGHFYPAGSYKNLRFNEDNVHSQCWWNCNSNKSGNLLEYRPRLIIKIGQDAVDELDRLRNVPARYTIPELKEMIIKYKELNKQYK